MDPSWFWWKVLSAQIVEILPWVMPASQPQLRHWYHGIHLCWDQKITAITHTSPSYWLSIDKQKTSTTDLDCSTNRKQRTDVWSQPKSIFFCVEPFEKLLWFLRFQVGKVQKLRRPRSIWFTMNVNQLIFRLKTLKYQYGVIFLQELIWFS